MIRLYGNFYRHGQGCVEQLYYINIKMRVFVANDLWNYLSNYYIVFIFFINDRIYHRIGYNLNSDLVS